MIFSNFLTKKIKKILFLFSEDDKKIRKRKKKFRNIGSFCNFHSTCLHIIYIFVIAKKIIDDNNSKYTDPFIDYPLENKISAF